MPRIYNYHCPTCNRDVERFADGTRVDPVRCVITANCTGLLNLTNERYGARLNPTPYVEGLEDRPVRGLVVSSTPVATLSRTSISSSASPSLTLLISDAVDTNSVQLIMRELSINSLTYNRFVFQRTLEVPLVVGRDDSFLQSTLFIGSNYSVQVYVNGVFQPSSTYTYTSSSVIFTTPIVEPSITVEVFTTPPLTTVSTDIPITFQSLPNSARSNLAWGNAQTVNGLAPLFCTDLSALDQTKAYLIDRCQATISGIPFTIVSGELLLANSPYSFTDINKVQQLTLSALATRSLTFVPDPILGSMNLTVNSAVIVNRVRPLNVQTLGLTSGTPISISNQQVTSYILGPT